MEVVLYTIHCPACNILEEQLQKKGINYKVVDNTDTIMKKGISTVPMLEVDSNLMSYSEAWKWTEVQKQYECRN